MPPHRRWNKVHLVTSFVNEIRSPYSSKSLAVEIKNPDKFNSSSSNNNRHPSSPSSSSSSSSSSPSSTSFSPFILESIHALFSATNKEKNKQQLLLYEGGKEKEQGLKSGNGGLIFSILIISITLIFVFGAKKVAFSFTLLAFLLWFLEFWFNSFTMETKLDKEKNMINVGEMVMVSNIISREEFNNMIKEKEKGEAVVNSSKDNLDSSSLPITSTIKENEGEGRSEREEQIKKEENNVKIDEESGMMVIKQYENVGNAERTTTLQLKAGEGDMVMVGGYPLLTGLEVDEDGSSEIMTSAELREKRSKKFIVKKFWNEKFVVKKIEVEKFVVKKLKSNSKNKKSNKKEGKVESSIVQFDCSPEIERMITGNEGQDNENGNERGQKLGDGFDPSKALVLSGTAVQNVRRGSLERTTSADIRKEQLRKCFKKIGCISKNKRDKEGKLDTSILRLECSSDQERAMRGEEENDHDDKGVKRKLGDGCDSMKVLALNENRVQNAKQGNLARTTSTDIKMKQFKKFVNKLKKKKGSKEDKLDQTTVQFDCSPGMERVTIVEQRERNQEDNDGDDEVEAIMSEVNAMLGDGYDLVNVSKVNDQDQNARDTETNNAEPKEKKIQKYVIKKFEGDKFSFKNEELLFKKFESGSKNKRGFTDVTLGPSNAQVNCTPERQISIRGREEEQEQELEQILEGAEDGQNDDEEPDSEVVYEYDSICISETSSNMPFQENGGKTTNLSKSSFIPVMIILVGLLNGRIMALVLCMLWFILIQPRSPVRATRMTKVKSYHRKNTT